jgi:signal transduction histidine kinase
MCFKAICFLYLYNNLLKIEFISAELVRMIIYHFNLTSIIVILKFEASILIYSFYFFLNLIIIFLTIYKGNWDFHYIFEAIISFGQIFIFFAIRKYFEYLSRLNFAENYRVKHLNNINSNFIKGLKNNHIILKKEKIVYINEEFSNYLEKEVLNFYQFNNNIEFHYHNTDVNISTLNLNLMHDYLSILKELVKIDENIFINNNNFINNNYREEDYLWSIILSYRNKINIDNNEFIKLGTFQFKNFSINKFYNVEIRNYRCLDNTIFQDLIFYDVSNILSTRKKINEDNLIKEKILAKMAHELKTPLNTILALIDVMSDNKNNIYMQNYSECICRNNSKEMKCISGLSNYTINLVNDIIQNSSNNKNMNINKESTSLIEILKFCNNTLEALLYTKKSQVEPILDIDDLNINNIKILTDHIRFKQILLNLISNSVKFCKIGFISIKGKYFKELNMVRVIITDTGIGIKKEDMDKLFNDYVMLEDKENLNKQGSGLGLSICKSLSDLLDLKLEFKSEYGKGTEISIDIPILQIDEIEDELFRDFSINGEQIPGISNLLYYLLI